VLLSFVSTQFRRCPPPGSDLFPLDEDPWTWPTCDDAYDFSWHLDPEDYLVGMTGG